MALKLIKKITRFYYNFEEMANEIINRINGVTGRVSHIRSKITSLICKSSSEIFPPRILQSLKKANSLEVVFSLNVDILEQNCELWNRNTFPLFFVNDFTARFICAVYKN